MGSSPNIGLWLQLLAIFAFIIGVFFAHHQKKPGLPAYLWETRKVIDQVLGTNFFENTKVTIRPLEINTVNPTPEIGHNSEYELDIITTNPIAKFPLTIRVPDSTWAPDKMFSLFNDTVTGGRAWYSYKLKDNYATFEIRNAAGKYHLTFGNTKPEQLTIKDLSW